MQNSKNKLASSVDAIAISNLKLSMTDSLKNYKLKLNILKKIYNSTKRCKIVQNRWEQNRGVCVAQPVPASAQKNSAVLFW